MSSIELCLPGHTLEYVLLAVLLANADPCDPCCQDQIFGNLQIRCFSHMQLCGRDSAGADVIPMVVIYVPRNILDNFLDQGLGPCFTCVSALQPFIVSMLNILPAPNTKTSQQKIVRAYVLVLLQFNCAKSIAGSDRKPNRPSPEAGMLPFLEGV
jgi:hypothetical protein